LPAQAGTQARKQAGGQAQISCCQVTLDLEDALAGSGRIEMPLELGGVVKTLGVPVPVQ